VAGVILLESGSTLLLEDGFDLLLEDGGGAPVTDYGYVCLTMLAPSAALSVVAPTVTITASKDC
jgi:hypothetical protein